MKRIVFILIAGVTVVNLLVISTFLDGDLKAFSPGDQEEVNCDCSFLNPPDGPDGGSMILGFGYPGGWGCYLI